MMKNWNDLTYDERSKALAIAYTYYHTHGYFTSQAQIPQLMQIINDYRFTSMLDYGCGSSRDIWKSSERMIPTLKVYYPYDPYSTEAKVREYPTGQRFDLVSCTDVLEHILPEDIDDVLADLVNLTGKMLYLTICLSPAGKKIVDENGKEAYDQSLHTIVESKRWWLDRIAIAERHLRWKEERAISIKIIWT